MLLIRPHLQKLVVLLLLIFKSVNASAGVAESFCRNETMQSTCLLTLLEYKCVSYSGLSLSVRRSTSCAKAAKMMVDFLDLTSAPLAPSAEFQEEVAFKSNLISLIEKTETTAFLDSLQQSLDQKLSVQQNFSLWDEVFELSKRNRNNTLAVLAILFQDTSERPQHIAYLKSLKLSTVGKTNVEKLRNLLTYFSKPALEQLKSISVYPAEYQTQLNVTFYHFYFTAYLSQNLSEMGVSLEMSFFLPFLMNTIYEFKNVAPQWPWIDPAGKTDLNVWKTTEIYAGYIGAMAGINKTSTAYKKKDFSDLLKSNPTGFIQALYYSRFNPEQPLSYQ